MGGKRISRGAVNSVAPAAPASLAHAVDQLSGIKFLIDTGAAYSVIPHESSAPARGPPLRGAGGSPIRCWGSSTRTVKFGGQEFTWPFLRAAVQFPLLGADFLRTNKLMVDLDSNTVLVKSSGIKIPTSAVSRAAIFASVSSPAQPAPDVPACTSPSSAPSHLSTAPASAGRLHVPRSRCPVAQVIAEFPDVCNASKLLPPAKHAVQHVIETSGRPVASKYRRLDAEKLAAAKAEFLSLEQQGIIRRSSSSWASPLHMVKKPDGSWRPCGDFRRLNLQTEPDKYSVPNIADLAAKLHGARVFSKLDLRKGYHQVPVNPSDVQKTAICTPFGLFEFIRMPFGLKNAGQTFQRMMDNALGDLDFCFIYMDDLLIASKEALCRVATIAHPDPAARVYLAVDASDTHVGAVLQQQARGGGPQPLGFFSKKLDPAQQKYSAFDRELLACYLGVRHFRHQLEGRSFYIETDHKPLTFALHRVSEPWSARQTRQLSYLAEFTADLRHVPGVQNVVADTLSRPPPTPAGCCGISSAPASSASATPSPDPQSSTSTVDFAGMARAQDTCPGVQKMQSSSSLKVEKVHVEGTSMLCDVSTGVPRPLVPTSWRPAIFSAVHTLAHPGIRATRRMISSRFVWSRMSADVAAWCRDCQGCARGKVHKHVHTPVQSFTTPSRRFAHLHVDLVGPLPASRDGFTHLFTIVDRTTRWPEAVLLKNTTAADCAAALTSGWIARFGVPSIITSDRGVQFTSQIWQILCKTLRIKHVVTTAYHPQSNGLVERFHRQLKNALKSRACGVDWADHLPWVMLGIRAAPKEDSAVSAAEMVFGSPLTLPGQILTEEDVPADSTQERANSAVEKFEAASRSYAEVAGAAPGPLATAELVYVRRGAVSPPLTQCYSGPFKVLERGPKVFRLQMGEREEVVSADRLKPHTGTTPTLPVVPPRRGRVRMSRRVFVV